METAYSVAVLQGAAVNLLLVASLQSHGPYGISSVIALGIGRAGTALGAGLAAAAAVGVDAVLDGSTSLLISKFPSGSHTSIPVVDSKSISPTPGLSVCSLQMTPQAGAMFMTLLAGVPITPAPQNHSEGVSPTPSQPGLSTSAGFTESECHALYQKAISSSPTITPHIAKAMIIGPPGVGKTALRHLLLGHHCLRSA